jgi:hypothetical protein
VIVFHIMGDLEMQLDYKGSFTFQDLETKAVRKVNTIEQKEAYAQRVEKWIKKSRLWMYERQITYHLVRLSEPFEKSLRDFLKIRKSLIQ